MPPDLEEACETLRYLRDQAANHYETINNWFIVELVDQALAALKKFMPAD